MEDCEAPRVEAVSQFDVKAAFGSVATRRRFSPRQPVAVTAELNSSKKWHNAGGKARPFEARGDKCELRSRIRPSSINAVQIRDHSCHFMGLRPSAVRKGFAFPAQSTPFSSHPRRRKATPSGGADEVYKGLLQRKGGAFPHSKRRSRESSFNRRI